MKYIYQNILSFILLMACISNNTHAQYSTQQTPKIKDVELSSIPLYAAGTGEKPTLTLALSVEYPTVGAQYRDDYVEGNEYIGYFDSTSCYTYTQNSAQDERYFKKIGATNSNYECGGAGFSGNFMNWATSSSIDVLRLGLTGGDRIIDSKQKTVLQRAVLQKDFFNSSSDFPKKTISKDIALKYLPEAMVGNSSGKAEGPVRISNCLNRVYFFPKGIEPSSSGTNGCIDEPPITAIAAQGTPSKPMESAHPLGFTRCANADYETCKVKEPSEVIFGTKNKWISFYTDKDIECNYQKLGDPAPGKQKYCWKKKLSNGTDIRQPLKDIAGNGDNFYYTKVEVCDTNESRKNFCQRYPEGTLKPVGNLQKYSDRLRVAAFGYLMENGTSRHGGVLRAPMKFVGPKTYEGFQSSTNANAEWDSNTGIFKQNPDNSPEGNSGVINYLNKFGRTGEFGKYKSNDPVGELYYESLRYLQGLSPTSKAIENLTNANKDGFAVYTSWEDPFKSGSAKQNYSCLRNSILTISDKFTHADKSLPGNTYEDNNDFKWPSDTSKNEPNFVEWTKIVSSFESGRDLEYTDGEGKKRKTTTPSEFKRDGLNKLEEIKNTGTGSAAYFIAGAAYWANTHDIRGSDWTLKPEKQRPGLRVKTYVLDVNERKDSNDSNKRWNSQLFLTAKYGGFTDINGDGNPYTGKDGDHANDVTTKYWAKGNDRKEAKTYFLASDAKSVLQALDDIFAAATQTTSSIAKPAISGRQMTDKGLYYYQADFDPEYWSGDVLKRTMKLSGESLDLSSSENTLSAKNILDSMSNDEISKRKIFAGKPTRSNNEEYATTFQWNDIDHATKEYLNKESIDAQPDNLGKERLNFIRGDRSLEATTFRKRDSRLGDIINSGITYSGTPSAGYSDLSYKKFYEDNKNRSPAIFVGANDGMLHAFNANTMEEIFAYIPSWIIKKISLLTALDYNSSRHTSYVDATPTVSEAQINNQWKTILVSGTGNGGQGIFALDVTAPDSFSAANVIWEFTDADDASLGNVVGQPKILKFKASKSSTEYKWFAVVPSGINNYVADGKYSTSGEPTLFLLDLNKKKNEAWQLGKNYFKITFPLSDSAKIKNKDEYLASGTINFNATANNDGSVQYIYIGDLHGQLWKLDANQADFTQSAEENWSLSKLSSYIYNSNPIPLYVAKDKDGTNQPISMSPTLAYGPNGSFIVGFGTGKYLEGIDNSVNNDTQIQSFYVIFDDNKSFLISNDSNKGRSFLAQASVDSSNQIKTSSFIWKAPSTSNGSKYKSGWYIDLPNSGSSGGERQVTSAALFGKQIIFNSLLPPSSSTSACGGGSSITYTAELTTGIGNVSALSNDALGAPVLISLGFTYSATGAVGDRVKTQKVGIINPSATGPGNNIQTKEAEFQVGRLNWRQIHNYRELKNMEWK